MKTQNFFNFANRKAIHYFLLFCIVIIQLLLGITWYYEKKNDKKLVELNNKVIDSENLLQNFNSTTKNLANTQLKFQEFYNNKTPENLNTYLKSYDTINKSISLIDNFPNNELKNILNKQLSSENSSLKTRKKIDSILNKYLDSKSNFNSKNPISFNELNYSDILNSIDIESKTKVDSVKKKGLFGRLGSALAGKTDVQTEKKDVIIKMKFGKNVTSGSLQQQIESIFKNTNAYYQKQFLVLKNNFKNLNTQDFNYLLLNKKLLNLNTQLLNNYSEAINGFYQINKFKFSEQEKYNKKFRSNFMLFLFISMLLIIAALAYFTSLAFKYQKQLVVAQTKIQSNLNFKNRIVGMLSHEIRSPLSSISIYSRRVATKIDNELIKNEFKSIDFTANSLLLMANQILEFSKNETNKLELKQKKTSIFSETNQILNSLLPICELQNNELTIQNNFNENLQVQADIIKIQQLFYNIIGNANKFTKKGKIVVVCNQENLLNNQVNLKFSIADTGKGISKTDLTKIFESYYQGINVNNVSEIGAGLGLNLCKEIVELYNGKITIESNENVGTIVVFNLIVNLEK